jgi:hypothetical protein
MVWHKWLLTATRETCVQRRRRLRLACSLSIPSTFAPLLSAGFVLRGDAMRCALAVTEGHVWSGGN